MLNVSQRTTNLKYGLVSMDVYILVMDNKIIFFGHFLVFFGTFWGSNLKVMGTVETFIPLIWDLATTNWKYGLVSAAVYFLVKDNKGHFLVVLGVFLPLFGDVPPKLRVPLNPAWTPHSKKVCHVSVA